MANEAIGKPIYLDYNASTPIDPAVAAVMRPLLEEAYGNPSSGHWASAPAKAALENARGQVAALLGCAADEVVFTSGGSEANNLALKGLFFRAPRSPVAHRHVADRASRDPGAMPVSRAAGRDRDLCSGRRQRPCRSRRHPQGDHQGHVSDQHHAREQRGRHDPADRRNRARSPASTAFPLHTDAAQSVGKIPTKVNELGVDLLSVAGHKVYAPKGIGALYIRRGIEIEPLDPRRRTRERTARRHRERVAGGGPRQGLRGCASLDRHARDAAPARPVLGSPPCRLRQSRRPQWPSRAAVCPTRSMSRLPAESAPRSSREMPDVAASTGSACHSGQITLSPVLEAMGIAPEIGMGAIRFSLGRGTTQDEVEEVVDQLRRVLA